METVMVSSESALEVWAEELLDTCSLRLDRPKYWYSDGRPKKTPWSNPQRKLARSWDRSPPNLVAVGSPEFGSMVLRVLNQVFITFNNDGWNLKDHDWTSSPKDLNYLVSVVGETYPGWPFAVRNLQILPDEEASLLARGATEDNLPWYEKDGSVDGDFKLGNSPITVFASTTDLSRVANQLVDIFTVQLIDREEPRP